MTQADIPWGLWSAAREVKRQRDVLAAWLRDIIAHEEEQCGDAFDHRVKDMAETALYEAGLEMTDGKDR